MKILAEISEATLGLGETEQLGNDYTLRKSARAILLNEAGLMATQYLQTYGYHKLPGGGVDQGETVEGALQREIKEEVGCDCTIVAPVGVVIEYRNTQGLLHISYCYVAQVEGVVGKPSLEEKEIEEGQVTLWLPPETVLAAMKTDVPHKFTGHFILQREIAFLTAYLGNRE